MTGRENGLRGVTPRELTKRLQVTVAYPGAVNESISLGRIVGIKIGMNWSLIAIFGLIAWSLADGRFPYDYPGYSESLYWFGAVGTTIIFFACLLAHEMGHALVARSHGVEVVGITLWLFGGVAKLQGDSKTAASEFKIAIAGPIVSVAVALIFAGVSWLAAAVSAPELVVGISAWLWRINAMLAAFNMLPAFPLDGGRVLRAAIWRFKGREKATRFASRVGRGFGYLMISAGLLEFAVRGSFDGIWIGFLGYFLITAATTEERIVTARTRPADEPATEEGTPAPGAEPESSRG